MNTVEIIGQIGRRSDGDCYLGVVGPVRVGKSTFIKRFMELVVIDNIGDPELKKRTQDELPQSGSGKTIMTSEPKFVPSKAIPISVDEGYSVNVRLIDCVGYLIDDSLGYLEDGKMRLVKTPWFSEPIPFDEAARIGTEKVIKEHSTIGIMVTTDGSFGEFKRENYLPAEEKIVAQLQEVGKPFVIVLNTVTPGAAESQALRDELSSKYGVPVVLLDIEHMNVEEANAVLTAGLKEFPITSIALALPTWVNNLSDDHYIKVSLNETVTTSMEAAFKIKDVDNLTPALAANEYIKKAEVSDVDLGTGVITITLDVKDELYDQVLKELVGCEISDKNQLIKVLSEFVQAKKDYDLIGGALKMAEATGYGFASANIDHCVIQKPETFKSQGRYGIKVQADAPTYHIIKVETSTAFEPILGSKEQSDYFLKSLQEAYEKDPKELLECELFGQKIKDIINGGIASKLSVLPEPIKIKLQTIIKTISNKGKTNLIAFVF